MSPGGASMSPEADVARLEIEDASTGPCPVWFCRGATRSLVDRIPRRVELGGPGVPTETQWDAVTLFQDAGVFYVERRCWSDVHVIGDSSTSWSWQRSTDGVTWERCGEPETPGVVLSSVSSLA